MNISSEIFPTEESNFSDYYFHNNTEGKTVFSLFAVDIMSILLGFPINSYVIWLIVTGAGNGLAAEFFSFNLAVCEMLLCIESFLFFLSYKFRFPSELYRFFDVLATTGRPLFQCLMCVERYLAVVHPVTFLKYKHLRYKAICSVIVWMTVCVSGGTNIVLFFHFNFNLILLLGQFPIFFVIQLFCLVAVLRALKQSGPGEKRRERKEENHMKRRAFNIILITTVTTLMTFFPFTISVILASLGSNAEALLDIGYVSSLLAGLVQPVLFFYRIGKLC